MMPDQVVALPPGMLQPILQCVNGKLGCLAELGIDGQSIGRGTATFVSVNGRQYLVTAQHVIEDLLRTSREIDLVIGRKTGAASVSIQLKVTRDSVRWESAELDVAVLEAPKALVDPKIAQWFDFEEGRKLLPRLRTAWQNVEAPYLVIGAGFANFTNKKGRLDSGQLVEAFGLATIPAKIERLSPLRMAHTPITVSLIFDEPTVGTGDDPSSALGQLASQFANMVRSNPANNVRDLKGMSGGPLVIITDSGAELIGVICRGPDEVPWNKRLDAVLLDQIDPSRW